MKRDIDTLVNNSYDLLVIGAGIQGSAIAWDATQRGLSVALVDRADFGSATSANSLKTIHGGLRYLQDANLRLVRKMIHERRAFMRIAPHLVRPMPSIMPTYSTFIKSKPVMAAAIYINDILAYDRNQSVGPRNHLPRGRSLSRDECLALLPGIAKDGITGGVLWFDGQMLNSERMTLSFVLSAAEAGAQVANYLAVTAFLRENDRIVGVRAYDVLADQDLEIRAGMVVNASGPWVDDVLNGLRSSSNKRMFKHSLAMNLVTRQFIREYAAGIPSRPMDHPDKSEKSSKTRMLFIAPWQELSIVGTFHSHYHGHPDDYRINERDLQSLIEETNSAYPEARLRIEDICSVQYGFLPAIEDHRSNTVRLVREAEIYDHRLDDGIDGLISVVGVKYTSAREVAQRVVDLVFKISGRDVPVCRTHITPLFGGDISEIDASLFGSGDNDMTEIDDEVRDSLVTHYGSNYHRVLQLTEEDSTHNLRVCRGSPVIRAQVIHAVRHEMASKLSDVVFRRTDLGSFGSLPDGCLRSCADLMASEMGWDRLTIEEEIHQVKMKVGVLN